MPQPTKDFGAWGAAWRGDCLATMPELASGTVDAILCDLPYGTTANKWDSVIDLSALWARWRTACRRGAPIVLTSQQPFTSALVSSAYEHFRYEWIWEKHRPVGHLNARRRPMSAHESVLVFCSETPPYHPQGLVFRPHVNRRGKTENYNDAGNENRSDFVGYPRSVLKIPHDNSDKQIHPTQKPVALFRYLIRTYTSPGELVLDCTAGSGTTAIACIREGRRFAIIEQDETYFARMVERISTEIEQTESAGW